MSLLDLGKENVWFGEHCFSAEVFCASYQFLEKIWLYMHNRPMVSKPY